ncbi:MAG: type I 3-dehydroquinate dehydratase [Verrucomicrobiales bacterium]|jgi:3-dehydroquinate dehydratase-1|nr:type I 3-dehydroquinate dehydratase [Verrucomicrobiales bacterium]
MAKNIWKKQPIYVGVVSTKKGLSLIAAQQPAADLIELRFDTLYAANTDALDLALKVLPKRKNPVLLTLRTKSEGGSVSWKSTERLRLFEKLIPYVDAVDFELANLPLMKSALTLARQLDKKVILSAHSTTHKITYKSGLQWLDEFRHVRAEIYKISSLARTQSDLHILAKLLINHAKLRLAVMATGPMSVISRQALPLLGSRLVYGYLDVPSAKKQPSIQEIRNLMAQ